MSLVLDLPTELETELTAEATHLGLPLPEYSLRILAAGWSSKPARRTGAELLAHWQGEDVVSTLPETTDAPAHAHALREQAQWRVRP